jgi:transposase-like protein
MEKDRKGQGNVKYSETFKLQVIQAVLKGTLTKEAARELYGIRSKSAILEWTRQYSGEKGYDKKGRVLKKKGKKTTKDQLSEQAKRILALEEDLRIEKLKVTLSNTMIDIAEEEFGINIRKKSGAKQSKKLKQTKESK